TAAAGYRASRAVRSPGDRDSRRSAHAHGCPTYADGCARADVDTRATSQSADRGRDDRQRPGVTARVLASPGSGDAPITSAGKRRPTRMGPGLGDFGRRGTLRGRPWYGWGTGLLDIGSHLGVGHRLAPDLQESLLHASFADWSAISALAGTSSK